MPYLKLWKRHTQPKKCLSPHSVVTNIGRWTCATCLNTAWVILTAFTALLSLDNYSRAIVASALCRQQDLKSYLVVLYAAIKLHGIPETLVSDSGSIFIAKQARQIYEALGIEKSRLLKEGPGKITQKLLLVFSIVWLITILRKLALGKNCYGRMRSG